MEATTIQIQPSCSDEYDPALLPVDQARQHIFSELKPTAGCERLAIRSALERVLAEDIVSPIDVPAHTNSAMDGYAVAACDLPQDKIQRLALIGTSWAGKPFTGLVHPGQAVRIMTGGVMPEGTDTVIMQEHVEPEGDTILIGTGHRPGQNVRAAGEDMAKGQVILTAATQILPAQLGLLASLGVSEVTVTRRLRVAFFSTGDELRSIGEPLEKGQIYDSNRYTLYGMLSRLGVDSLDMGVVRDEPLAVRQVFLEAAELADVVITSGGVSVGEADYVKETLEELGAVRFWKIAMKPGRPLAFGRIGDALFFGLPGNPVSVMVTFYQFVQPALQRLMGAPESAVAETLKVRCISKLKKRPGRMEFQRGILERDADGDLVVRSTGQQGSGILYSMSVANCFVILPIDTGTVEPGTLVDVQPFSGLV